MVKMELGGWVFNVCGVDLQMPSDVLNEIEGNILPRWREVWPREEKTLALTEFGVPSVLVRIDAALDGKLGIFEIEERPAGIGISCLVNSEFKCRFQKWLGSYEWNLAVVISHRRTTHDDGIWTREFGIPLFKEDGPPKIQGDYSLLVRAEPDEKEYWSLESRALFPIRLKGWKGYGIELGLWEPIPEDLDRLPWEEGFVIKPHQGSKMKGIFLWHPDKLPGTSTRKKIKEAILSGQAVYWQRWIAPESHDFLPPGYFLIRRIYFGFDPHKKRWDYLGGLWNARPNLRVHGASDAIFGPLIP